MTVTFIHTADWQLGKAFGSVEDVQQRSVLQQNLTPSAFLASIPADWRLCDRRTS